MYRFKHLKSDTYTYRFPHVHLIQLLTLNFFWILFQLNHQTHVIHIFWYRGLQGSWRESVPYWTSRWLPATGIVSLSPGRRRGWKVQLLCVIGFCVSMCTNAYYIYIYTYIWICMNSHECQLLEWHPDLSVEISKPWTTRSCARVVCHDGRLHRTGRRLEMLHKKFVLVPRWTE